MSAYRRAAYREHLLILWAMVVGAVLGLVLMVDAHMADHPNDVRMFGLLVAGFVAVGIVVSVVAFANLRSWRREYARRVAR